MLLPDELEPIDYEILKLVNKYGIMSEEEIYKKMNADIESIKLRISLLSTPDYRPHDPRPLSNSCYLDKLWEESKTDGVFYKSKYLGKVKINAFGKKTLEDMKSKNLNDFRKFLFRSVLTPIAVSIVTTILTLLITKHLGIYL